MARRSSVGRWGKRWKVVRAGCEEAAEKAGMLALVLAFTAPMAQ